MIPSYGRAGAVSTVDFFSDAKIVVPEKQYAEYAKFYARSRLIAIPDERDGRISRKRNAVIEVSGANVVMLDDDFRSIFRISTNVELNESEAIGLFEQAFDVCSGIEAHLWGVNWDHQKLHVHPGQPFSLTKPFFWILGVIKTELRFDERLSRMEDVDFWLQHTRRDTKTLRFNHYCSRFRMKQKRQRGGISEKAESVGDVEMMRRKWGTDVLTIRGNDVWPPKSPYAGV